ncbi:MAG TPA: DUF6141 family protein [Saprospiraceae bacterium]|nr:DUF6141 family protein [Saprospiraceae bacterium]
MDNEVLFTETQGFRQWWLWVILLGTDGLFAYGIYTQLIQGVPFGDNPASDPLLIIVFVMVLLLTVSFYIYRLETTIRKDGIYIRFLPYMRRYTYYPFAKLSKVYVRKYSPIAEYGGWGFRGGAYNVSGDQGLQIQFTDHKKLLIGTRKPEEIAAVLRKLGQYKEFYP